VRFGPFVLEEHLATGGSAEVWVASPIEGFTPAPQLVIKRLLPMLLRDDDARSIFAEEARLYRFLHHPNIIACYGAGEVDGEPYLAMELVHGADLLGVLRLGRREGFSLPVGVAVHVALELLAALAVVHDAVDDAGRPLAMVHRDISPSNVYLSTSGDVKLGDFGIARTRSGMRTPINMGIRGKFGYLTPEQIAGAAVDRRTDLFSLASVLCEMMLGAPLFEGSGKLAVLLAIRDARVDPLDGQHDIPPPLVAVLKKALARDPSQRYANAAELAAAIAPFAMRPANLPRAELADLVARVRTASGSVPVMLAAPPSMFPAAPVAMSAPEPSYSSRLQIDWNDLESPAPSSALGTTAQVELPTSHVITSDGRTLGPLGYPELVELVASGKVGADDRVDYLGEGLRPIGEIEDLARYLGAADSTTTRIAGPGSPDFYDHAHVGERRTESSTSWAIDPGIARALGWIAATHASGALFATTARRRREIYFHDGQVLQVAPGAPSGSSFEAQRQRAFQEVVDVFRWNDGELAFYAGAEPARVTMPLALMIGPIVEAGVASMSEPSKLLARHHAWADRVLVASPAREDALDAGWSPRVRRIVTMLASPMTLSALERMLILEEPHLPAFEIARSIEAARVAGLIEKKR
jgi:serine/threonine protein kinase